MKKSEFTEEQVAFALKQAEMGTRVAEICRKMGISEATFFKARVCVYRSCKDDTVLTMQIREIAETRIRYVY